MHQYSVDYDRKIIYFLLVSTSIAITSLINYYINLSYIVITAFSVFGVMFLLFNNFLWKSKILHKLGIVKTPNLIGTWEGIIRSSYHEFNEEIPACIIIKQTWTHIFIKGNFNQSKSYSISANLEINGGARTILQYVYMNQNNLVKTEGTMNPHSGLTILEFTSDDADKDSAEGKYYNEPPQNANYGVLNLKKV